MDPGPRRAVQHDEDSPQNLKAQHLLLVQEGDADVHEGPRHLGDFGADDVTVVVRQFLIAGCAWLKVDII